MAANKPPDDDDLDQTVVIPTPAGKTPKPPALPEARPPSVNSGPTSPSTSPSAAGRSSMPAAGAEPPTAVMPAAIGRNPLLRSAATVFALVRGLYGLSHHDDIKTLHRACLHTLVEFEKDAQAAGVTPQAAFSARYLLSALIDETVLSTPWGSESQWSKESLLVTLHKETWAGEKFFLMLQNLSNDPRTNIDILELLYACLLHGYQGKYRVLERGSDQLEQVKRSLFETIRSTRGEFERDLSPRWRGVANRRNRVARVVPIWVAPVVAAALTLLVFFFFNYKINAVSDPTFARLNALSRSLPIAQLTPPEIPNPSPAEQSPETLAMRLKELLKAEIDQGRIEVIDFGTATRVILVNQDSALFPSGSSIPGDAFLPALRKTALLLNEYPVPIEITGHTDNQQPRSGSNWKLSDARANGVRDVIAAVIDDDSRIVAEGRSDTEPIADNNTAAGRAKNRRVEIQVPVGYQTWAITADNPAVKLQ
jgi:type VI secretion system protein ImpK